MTQKIQVTTLLFFFAITSKKFKSLFESSKVEIPTGSSLSEQETEESDFGANFADSDSDWNQKRPLHRLPLKNSVTQGRKSRSRKKPRRLYVTTDSEGSETE